MKRLLVLLMVGVTGALTIGLWAQQQSLAQNRSQSVPEPRAAVIDKLQEIVSLRTRISESEQVMINAGRVPIDSSAEVDLIEARLELAREKNDKEAVLVELRNLVAAHQRRFERLKGVAQDRLPAADLDRARIGVLRAEVRLLREEK